MTSPSLADPERIAAELAALGEAPLAEDELASASEDVALVVGLSDLAEWSRPGPDIRPLSDIERRRVWGRVAGAARPASPAGGPMRRGLVPALAALAAAAAVVLMPRLTPPSSASLEDLSTAAHTGLAALGDPAPGSRAREVARALSEEEMP